MGSPYAFLTVIFTHGFLDGGTWSSALFRLDLE
jgi:hypothetical protein